jgi:predicted transcriptional regulator
MPGDFGGRRGIFSPTYWSIQSTQYGLLKNVEINEIGVFENNKLIRDDINFNTLKLYDGNTISLKLEIKPDAVYRGGINLFGKNFGDFNQAIVMTVK